MNNNTDLWDAINHYCVACGGSPATRIYGNVERQRAVVAVEKAMRRVADAARELLAEGTDGPVYNAGRSEGRADVCADLRAILDPDDKHHWNIDGVLEEVRRIARDHK